MRSHSLLLLCAIFCLTGSAAAQDLREAEVAFQEGLAAYYEAEFEAARDYFHAAESTGYTSFGLLYALGNTYFRLNKLGKAILYYERARRIEPANEDLNHSLRVATRQTNNRISRVPRPIWIRYWRAAAARIGPAWMYFVGLCFYLTAAAFLGVRIWTRSYSSWLRRGLLLSVLAAFVLFTAAFVESRRIRTDISAVVTTLEADLRELPAAGATVEMQVYEGLVVRVLGHQSNWVHVRLPDGSTGWMQTEFVEQV